MPICRICLRDRPKVKFQTGRISICGRCVHSLNSTAISPRGAAAAYREQFLAGLFRRHLDANDWAEEWLARNFGRILAEHMEDPARVGASQALKVLRAYRRRLICLDRRYLDYPANWDFKRYRLKSWHDYACHLCGKKESAERVLHAHHIVHRSNSGTNCYANLATVCQRCHQKLHPGIIIGADYGEGRGIDLDEIMEPENQGELGERIEVWPEFESRLTRDEWTPHVDNQRDNETAKTLPSQVTSIGPAVISNAMPAVMGEPESVAVDQQSPIVPTEVAGQGEEARMWWKMGFVLLTFVFFATLVEQCSR